LALSSEYRAVCLMSLWPSHMACIGQQMPGAPHRPQMNSTFYLPCPGVSVVQSLSSYHQVIDRDICVYFQQFCW
jgi:hypothetical protein